MAGNSEDLEYVLIARDAGASAAVRKVGDEALASARKIETVGKAAKASGDSTEKAAKQATSGMEKAAAKTELLSKTLSSVGSSGVKGMSGISGMAEKVAGSLSNATRAGSGMAALGPIGAAVGAVMVTVGLEVAAVAAAYSALSSAMSEGKDLLEQWTGEVFKLNIFTGGTIEDTSRLAFAINAVGIDGAAAGIAFNQFSKHLAANDKVAQALPITWKNAHGAILPITKTLPQLEELFKRIPAGPLRAAEALRLFGKGGAALLPLLTASKERLDAFNITAERTGHILGTEDVKAMLENKKAHLDATAAAQGAMMALGKVAEPLDTAWQNAKATIIGSLMPALQNDVVPMLQNAIKVITPLIEEWAPKIGAALAWVVTEMAYAVNGIAIWADRVNGFIHDVYAFGLTTAQSLLNIFASAAQAIQSLVMTIMSDIGAVLNALANATSSLGPLGNAARDASNGFNAMESAAGSAFDNIVNGAANGINAITAMINVANSATGGARVWDGPRRAGTPIPVSQTPTPIIPYIPSPNMPHIPRVHSGGSGGSHSAKTQHLSPAERALASLRDLFAARDYMAKATGTAAQINAMEKLVDKLINATDLSARKKNGLTEMVERDTDKLLLLAGKRARVISALAATQSNMTNLMQQSVSIASSVAQSIKGLAKLTDGTGVISVWSVLDDLGAAVAKAAHFKGALAVLKKRGLSTGLMDQIVAAGPDRGNDLASALVAMNGSQFSNANKLSGQLDSLATSTGKLAADSMYSAGIRAAQGLVEGLKKQQSAIEKQMVAIAEAMKSSIKKALGIKSPSQVMHQIGLLTAQGMANGIKAGTPNVMAALVGMGAHGAASGSGYQAGGAGVTVVNVYGVIGNKEQTGAYLHDMLLRRETRISRPLFRYSA